MTVQEIKEFIDEKKEKYKDFSHFTGYGQREIAKTLDEIKEMLDKLDQRQKKRKLKWHSKS